MLQPCVITIILNTNRRDDTLACLASLVQNTYANHHIIVLDNQSTDGSVAAIRAGFPDVRVAQLRENHGYAGNNNVGIRMAMDQGADWVFVLNEDTILAPDCLAHLVAAGERDAKVGIAGPMVYHFDEPEVIQSAGGRLGPYWDSIHIGKDEPDRGQYAESHPVQWISGCGILVRRSAIEQAGMIDERYFYYWEETEWCLRARRAGWRVIHVPEAKLWHKGVRRDYRPKPSVTYYATRNRLLTLAKHHAPPQVWLYVVGQMARTLVSWSVKPKWREMREHRDAMWHGLCDFFSRRWGQMPS